MTDYNERFGVNPQDSTDAHRQSLPRDEQLKLIFSHQSTRKLSKQLELSYHNELFQIQTKTPAYTMRKARVTVCDHQGEITILYKGKSLPYKRLTKNNRPAPIIDAKQINPVLNQAKKKSWKPGNHHPWRKIYQRAS